MLQRTALNFISFVNFFIMSIIIGTSILFVVVIIICFAIIAISKKQTKLRTAELLNGFNSYGVANNLYFSSQEILMSAIIGLDGMNKKLLVLLTNGNTHQYKLIDLKHVKECSVIKSFRSISIDEWKGKNIEEYYERIDLHFEMKDEREPVFIPFYDTANNHFFEIPELEQKARYWETILSKMIYNRNRQIA